MISKGIETRRILPDGTPVLAVSPGVLVAALGDWSNDHVLGGDSSKPRVFIQKAGEYQRVNLLVKMTVTGCFVAVSAGKHYRVYRDDVLWVEDKLQPATVFNVTLESVAGDLLASPTPSLCNVEPVELVVTDGGWMVTDAGRAAIASELMLTDKGRRAARALRLQYEAVV